MTEYSGPSGVQIHAEKTEVKIWSPCIFKVKIYLKNTIFGLPQTFCVENGAFFTAFFLKRPDPHC